MATPTATIAQATALHAGKGGAVVKPGEAAPSPPSKPN
jgi:hypothetical protein